MADEKNRPGLSLAYPLGQLAKSLLRGGERARLAAERWVQVMRGMVDGSLSIGSRTPVPEVPSWVTLEVLHGGFASGNLAAGGPLEAHEREKLASLTPEATGSTTPRGRLNRYYLSDDGRRELSSMLKSRRYRVRLPEEAALLFVTWLVQHGEGPRAAAVLTKIEPLLDHLRFYPVPAEKPLPSGGEVWVATAGEAVHALRSARRNPQVERMNESLLVWTPLYDRAVGLFLETVEGEHPSLRRTSAGSLERGTDGQPVAQGGWPCKHFPQGWAARVKVLLDDDAKAVAEHPLCRKRARPKENYARLRRFLAVCAEDPSRLTGRDVGVLRLVLASYIAAHGAPGSEQLERTRAAQLRSAQATPHAEIGLDLAARLATQAPDEGSPDVGTLTKAVADRFGVAAVPEHIARKAARCSSTSPEELVQRRVITSGETLARVAPQVAARTRGSSIEDSALRSLYVANYLAFRRRRSLLLLDLESQVRLGELPWVVAAEPWVGPTRASTDAARQTLARVGALALVSFPQTIVPNRLVTELRALGAAAGLALPFVNELASDIFMGAFSETFLRASKTAAKLLQGSLYARYYGIPYEKVLRIDDAVKGERGAPTSVGLGNLCAELAGATESVAWSVARNGTIIEQAQIVTTHNLATLFELEEVSTALRPQVAGLARTCFEWVCHALRTRASRSGALRRAKNAAYAWRQMVFFLSLADEAELAAFLRWMDERLARETAEFRQRFEPAPAGLRAAAAGVALGRVGALRPFLGWSLGPHWILGRG